MMSGPAPVLAATAAFGRTSSQLSLSTRTSMPYFSVNACTFFMYWSMSPWTKRLQRSTRSLAPFSGALFHCACASYTQIIGAAAPAATPAPAFRKSLRLKLLTDPPPWLRFLAKILHRIGCIAARLAEGDPATLSQREFLALQHDFRLAFHRDIG